MNDKAIFDDIVEKIKVRIPNFEIRYKDESRLQRFIGFLLFFNKAYMTDYTTTMFGKVYFTSREEVEKNPKGAWQILAHEYVHLLDAKTEGWKFIWSYLAPQIYALIAPVLIAVGYFAQLWGLFALGFLCFGFLAPWPSHGRTKWETRGYAMSLAVTFWQTGRIPESHKTGVCEHFWSSEYYYMHRNRNEVKNAIEVIADAIEKHMSASVTHPFAVVDVKMVLRKHNALTRETGAESLIA